MTALTTRRYTYYQGTDPDDLAAATQALASSVDTDISASLPDLGVTSLGDWGSAALVTTTGGLGSSNQALVTVFRPRADLSPTKLVWWCTTQSGNYDAAIINATTRAKLWSKGSTACPTAGEVVETLTGVNLVSGTRYAFVFAANNTTLQLRMATMSATGLGTLYDGTIGVGTVAASFAIPSTLGAWSAGTRIPVMTLRA